jgi:hypothetical protein
MTNQDSHQHAVQLFFNLLLTFVGITSIIQPF